MWEIDFFYWSYCLCNIWQKLLYFISHLFFPSSWNCLYMTRKKKMIIGRSRREVNDVMCMYTCLWPSICSSSFFEKTARIQAHHMCYRRAHPFFFFFFPVLCLTCSIITPILHVDVCVSKEDEQRERERKT